jgi:hypothetical protein
MNRYFALAGAAMTVAVSLTSMAWSAASDYAFEPVTAEVKKGEGVTVAVRLKDKRSGKPVPDAVVFQTRIDMAPDGMAEMASPLTPLPSPEPGVYAFNAYSADAGHLFRYEAGHAYRPEASQHPDLKPATVPIDAGHPWGSPYWCCFAGRFG